MLSLLNADISARLFAYSPVFVCLILSAALVILPRILLKKVDPHTIPESASRFAENADRILFQRSDLNQQRLTMLLMILGVGIAYALRLALRFPPVFPLDDAYITLHNAQVLRSGNDPNYLGIPALVGATSGVHLVLTACALPFFSRSEWALDAVAWVGVLVYATGLLRLAFAFRASFIQSLLLATVGLCAGKTVFHLFNGLETGLAMGALCWALALSVREVSGIASVQNDSEGDNSDVVSEGIEQTPRFTRFDSFVRDTAFPTFLGMLPFIRPEFILISLMLLVLRSVSRWKNKETALTAASAFGKDIAFVAIGAFPWLTLSFANTGSFFPQTIAAKRAFFAETRPLHFVLVQYAPFLFRIMQVQLGIGIFGALLLPFHKIGRLSFAFIALFLLAYLTQMPGALLWNEQRYLYLLTPFALLGCASMFLQKKEFARSIGNILLLAAFFQTIIAVPTNWSQYVGYCEKNKIQLLGLREWCLQNLPAGSKIAVHDAGAISWETPFVLTDLVGLKSPKSVEFHKQYTFPSRGKLRAKAINSILVESHADYLILIEGWDKLYHFSDDLTAEGWRLEALRPNKPIYQVYKISPPGERKTVEGRQ